jgi:pyruvate kinase
VEPLPPAVPGTDPDEAMAAVVQYSIQHTPASAVFVPTRTGATARMISRFKPRVWIVAITPDAAVCQGLAFSYGVIALASEQEPDDWRSFTAAWLDHHGLPVRLAVLVAGPSPQNPNANLRIEFLHVWNAQN